MTRNIIEINRDLCNGCGLCAQACHEGAIEIIDGKATLVSDHYCDGLGDCLPACPTNAIQIIEKETVAYDEQAVKQRQAEKSAHTATENKLPCGCPGTMAKKLDNHTIVQSTLVNIPSSPTTVTANPSKLQQWPVQLRLINSHAEYLQNAHLLIAADCTAYAYGNFHADFMKDRITIIACPKLDDNGYNQEKLAEILANNEILSITVARMEVPCCGGMIKAVKGAMLQAQVIVPYREVVIGMDGNIKN